MGKKYVMFIDERGFLSKDIINNFSMVGVIFEYDYCIDLKNNQCELRTNLNQYKQGMFSNNSCNFFLDDIIVKEKTFTEIGENKRKEFINELPFLFKNLKFTIISSAIKQDVNTVKESYSIATKNLLENFNSFIIKTKGECGAIIMEDRDSKVSYIMQQSFFDVYNERNRRLGVLDDVQDRINTFIVSRKDNKTYGLGIEVANILNNILPRVSKGLKEIDSELMPYNTDRIFNAIKSKIYKDTSIQISNEHLQRISYSRMEIFNKELKTLKEKLRLKNIKINEKEKEINQLSNEIHLLNHQLKEALLNRKSDNIKFQILSDIEFKMNGLEKKSRLAEN